MRSRERGYVIPAFAGVCILACSAGKGTLQSGKDLGWVGEAESRPLVGLGPLRLAWVRRLTPENEGPYEPVEYASAALDPSHDRIYVGLSAGRLHALNSGGGLVYRHELGAAIDAGPAVDPVHDELYAVTADGQVHALRASNGKKRWAASAGASVRNAPQLSADAVYVVTEADRIVTFARSNGDVLWSYEREPMEGISISGHAGLVLDGDRVFAGFSDGTVVALRANDGTVLWERDTSLDLEAEGDTTVFYDVDTTPLVHDETVYAASFSAGLYAMSKANGTVQWRAPEYAGVVGIAGSGDHLVISSADRGVICLARSEGHPEVWVHPTQRGAAGTPLVDSGLVVVGESQGLLLSLSLASGKEIGRLDAGHGFTAPAVISRGLGAALSNAGTLFAFWVSG